MKYLPILAITLIFSSCGIFKKNTSNTFKQKKGYKLESNIQVKSQLKTIETNLNVDKSQITFNSKNRTTIYPTKNSEIFIGEDGSVKGSIDSIVQDITEAKQEIKDVVNKLGKETNLKVDSLAAKKEEAKEAIVTKEKVSTPDKSSISIIGVIGGIVIIVIVIIIIYNRRRII